MLRVSAHVPDQPRSGAAQAASPLEKSAPQPVDAGAAPRAAAEGTAAAGETTAAAAAAAAVTAELEAEVRRLEKRALDAEAKLEVRPRLLWLG